MDEYDLEIRPIETQKHKIPQRALMKAGVIPGHCSSIIFSGSSGSGKSTVLINLLTRKEFYKDYFDEIHLFSPTGASDDLFGNLKLKKSNIHIDMNPDDLKGILEKQEKEITARGVHRAKKLLVIFEDCQSNKRFMNSKSFLKSFIANRHYGMSTWLCSQSWTRTPRACRLQAFAVFFFKGSQSEHLILSEEYCPPGMHKKDFLQLIDEATREKHSFLFINCKLPHEERYRCCLSEIIRWK